ncbi:hypothetical protein WICMUC_004692 [Wickerhamomyces mucosus]|uniref:Enoyl-CoA hydratase n=1 Tax=Wickerhamomyces mucosus TaxID=1378264 RepID=A0A9P8PH18_9ASCO|nr:hypothetical protein WICMUC_004692 [Wickerhamomyces mucosus]
MSYNHFKLTYLENDIVLISINRPNKRNCFNQQTWYEFAQIFQDLSQNPQNIRVIILDGQGDHFCSGIQLSVLSSGLIPKNSKNSTFNERLSKLKEFQECIKIPLKINIPIISISHGVCFGLGIDIISATNIRICTKDVRFSIKEIDVGIMADIGSLQRLPFITNNISKINELALTGDEFDSDLALKIGLVSEVFPNKIDALNYALKLAQKIKTKYKPAVEGTKKHLELMTINNEFTNKGLDLVARENQILMDSPKFKEFVTKKFSKL